MGAWSFVFSRLHRLPRERYQLRTDEGGIGEPGHRQRCLHQLEQTDLLAAPWLMPTPHRRLPPVGVLDYQAICLKSITSSSTARIWPPRADPAQPRPAGRGGAHLCRRDPTAEIVVVVDATFEHRIDPSEREQYEQAELHGEVVSRRLAP